MRLHLQLPAKAGWFRISACEAERLVTWPANAFQIFLERPWEQKNLASKTDYLTEDGERVCCGTLILGQGRGDGIFAYDRGRQFAYLPGARAVVDAILDQAVEKIVLEGTENTNYGSWDYFFDELYEQMRLVVTEDNGVAALLLEKLRERPETAEATLTGESFDVRFHPKFCKNLLPEQEEMSQEGPVHDDAPTPQSRQGPMLHL